MIAIDTSSLIAYLADEPGEDVEIVDEVLARKSGFFPPVVLTEILSDSSLSKEAITLFVRIPILEIIPGFWERAGLLRAKVLGRKHKARLADCLIAQSCIDHGISLVTRDRDFLRFASVSSLKLLPQRALLHRAW